MTAEYSPLQPESQNQSAASGLDPHAECFETNTIPGITDQLLGEDRVPSFKLPSGEPLNFDARAWQLEFSFVSVLRPHPRARRRRRQGRRSSDAIQLGPGYTNVFHPRCRQFVTYLGASRRRAYFCGCGNIILHARDPLNHRDPSLPEWERLVATWWGRPPSFPFSKN
jgi:hypothetical protein